MKKIMVLLAGIFFLAGIEANACSISSECGDDGAVACSGNICVGGSGWVECYDSDGKLTRGTCAQQ